MTQVGVELSERNTQGIWIKIGVVRLGSIPEMKENLNEKQNVVEQTHGYLLGWLMDSVVEQDHIRKVF